MNRRSILKALFLGTSTARPTVQRIQAIACSETDDRGILSNRWHVLSEPNFRQQLSPGKPEMNWQIKNGELVCMAHLPNSTAFLSDYRLSSEGRSFKAEMLFKFNNELIDQAKHELRVAVRVSSPGQRGDPDKHIDAGISRDGTLFIGTEQGDKVLKEEIIEEPLRLVLSVTSQSAGGCFAKLRAFDRSGNTLATLSSTKFASSDWQGTIAILSHFTGSNIFDQPSVVISHFKIEGEKLVEIQLQGEDTNNIAQQ